MPGDTLVDRVRHDILEGVFSPGERLIEVDLADRYSCGRAAIRSALVQLETEALVDRRANKGAQVHRIPVAEAIEITEARRAVESLVAARAARNASDTEKQTLRQLISDMRAAVAEGDAGAYASLNRTLHEDLLAISRHVVAMELVRNLRNRGVQNQFRLAVVPGRQDQSLQQHAAIVEAVVSGDETGAARAMTDHLDSVIEVLGRWADAG
jgi:DNA-binding GntR family transcriptional regulator